MEVGTEKVSTHSRQCPEELLTAHLRVREFAKFPDTLRDCPKPVPWRPAETSCQRCLQEDSSIDWLSSTQPHAQTANDKPTSRLLWAIMNYRHLQRLSNTGIFRGNRAQGKVIQVLHLTADVQQMLVPRGRTRPRSRSWGRSTKHTHNAPTLPELLF